MKTNRADRIASIIEQRYPLVDRIKRVEAKLDSLRLAILDLQERREQILTHSIDSEDAWRLGEVDLPALQGKIQAELQQLDKLKNRFSRNTLNIGVVGLMGQGKSTLLQSLSGLTDAEIPARKGGACTAVRSTIYHHPSDSKADVILHSENSFLQEVIGVYYDELGLGSKPTTLDEFAQSLPALPIGDATKSAMYEHLRKDYYEHLQEYRPLLLPGTPRKIDIPKERIQEYVVQQRNEQGELINFKHLAVREVRISCPFNSPEIGNIALVDVPGLGDLRVGDEKLMLETLGHEVDIVLFVRMPSGIRHGWEKRDTDLYNLAAKELYDLPERSFMVLNKVGNESEGCQLHQNTISEKHIDVIQCIIADCSQPEKANEVLDIALDYLSANITTLDEKYARRHQKEVEQLHIDISAELDKANKALAQYGDEESLYVRLFKEFWDTLTDALEKLLKELKQQRNAEDAVLKAKVNEAIQNCRKDPRIPSVEQIHRKRNYFGSYEMAYLKYLDELRTHLSQHFTLLDYGLKESVKLMKAKIISVLVQKGCLEKFSDERHTEFLKIIAEKLPDDAKNLNLGFQSLLNFDLAYSSLIQYRIRQCLSSLNPDMNTGSLFKQDSPQAISGFFRGGKQVKTEVVIEDTEKRLQQKIQNNLKELHEEAVRSCEVTLKGLLCEPSQISYSMVEEFIDRVLRAENVEEEWRKFLKKERSQVWPEFKELDDRALERQGWLNSVEKAKSANHMQSMWFLS